MYKSIARAAPRRIATSRPLTSSSRRFLNTAPPSQKSRTWKSSFGRWGLAGLAVYYYNTSPVFAGEDGESVFLGQPAEDAIESVNSSIHSIQESSQPTLDAIVAEKRAREAQLAEANKKSDSQFDQVAAAEETEAPGESEEGLEGLEDEAGQQGAFDPVTGEINWDCPCLGGMAHGPCGEEFKLAFSCFVHSTEEPKGVECIEKFKGMQDCFRQHPEMYGSELADDEDDVEEEIQAQEAARSRGEAQASDAAESREADSPVKSAVSRNAQQSKPSTEQKSADADTTEGTHKNTAEIEKPASKPTSPPKAVAEKGAEEETVVPKAAFDASSK